MRPWLSAEPSSSSTPVDAFPAVAMAFFNTGPDSNLTLVAVNLPSTPSQNPYATSLLALLRFMDRRHGAITTLKHHQLTRYACPPSSSFKTTISSPVININSPGIFPPCCPPLCTADLTPASAPACSRRTKKRIQRSSVLNSRHGFPDPAERGAFRPSSAETPRPC